MSIELHNRVTMLEGRVVALVEVVTHLTDEVHRLTLKTMGMPLLGQEKPDRKTLSLPKKNGS